MSLFRTKLAVKPVHQLWPLNSQKKILVSFGHASSCLPPCRETTRRCVSSQKNRVKPCQLVLDRRGRVNPPNTLLSLLPASHYHRTDMDLYTPISRVLAVRMRRMRAKNEPFFIRKKDLLRVIVHILTYVPMFLLYLYAVIIVENYLIW